MQSPGLAERGKIMWKQPVVNHCESLEGSSGFDSSPINHRSRGRRKGFPATITKAIESKMPILNFVTMTTHIHTSLSRDNTRSHSSRTQIIHAITTHQEANEDQFINTNIPVQMSYVKAVSEVLAEVIGNIPHKTLIKYTQTLVQLVFV